MRWWDNLSIEAKWSVGAAVALLVWVGSGMVGRGEVAKVISTPIPEVQTHTVTPESYSRTVKASGFTESEQNAMLSAQTAGRVVRVPVVRGQTVKAGNVLAELDPADRLIRQRAAQAELTRTRKLAHAARALAKEGYMAGTVLAQREADYQAAQEKLAAANLDLAYTKLIAPFEGVVEDVKVSEGDFVAIGTPMVKLVSRENILVVAYVAQTDRNLVDVNVPVSVTLINGTDVPATLRAVATDADTATRTYRVEAVVDGGRNPIPTGMSADVLIPAGTITATRLNHAWMVLNDTGSLGVMTATTTSPTLARFVPVTLLADTPDGVWVDGLEASTHLITLGQAALKDGATIHTQEAP
ncbi:MAG: efflux RND transporter periplasmic adaptor subunit [Alphaproteobacteria bacterium]